jgi:hypothetical protein
MYSLRTSSPKLWGAFLTPISTTGSGFIAPNTQYNYVQSEWRDQMDKVAAMGLNFFAYQANAHTVQQAGTQAQWLANNVDVVTYAATKGLWVLPYGVINFTDTSLTINGTTVAQLATDIAALAAALDDYDNVIGIVGVDEAYQSSIGSGGSIADATVVGYVQTIYNAVRAAVQTSFPCAGTTTPCGAFASATVFTYSGANKTRCDNIAPFCDFFVFHPLYNTVSASDWATVENAYGINGSTSKHEFIFPSSTDGTAGDSPVANGIANLFTAVSSGNVRGAAIFSIKDFTGGTGWGLYDGSGVPRSTRINAVTTNLPVHGFPFRQGSRKVAGGSGAPVFGA